MLDGVVRRVLGHAGKGYWQDLRAELRVEDGRLADRLDGIRRSAGLDESISTIRVFHVLVWMTGTNPHRAGARTGADADLSSDRPTGRARC